MVKNKDNPSFKSRKLLETDRRNDISKGIEKLKTLIPYFRSKSSIPGQKPEDTKNDKLRLTTTFINVVSSKKYRDYWNNRDPQTEKLFNYFNQVRSEMKCSFFFTNGDTRILFSHGDVFEKLGYDVKDVIGRTMENLLIPPDELDNFRLKLSALKQELLTKKIQSKYFKFPCNFLHKMRNSSNRSQVIFSGNLVLSEDSIPCRRRIVNRKGNGHITVRKLDESDYYDPFFIFGQIEILSDEIFRQALLTVEKNEYFLYMTPSGIILGVDQRVVPVLGYFPEKIKNEPAHKFINPGDLRTALSAQYNLLIRREGIVETVHRLLDCSGDDVYVKSVGKLYLDNDKTIFKLHAIKIDKFEGETRLKKELELLPEKFRQCPLEDILKEINKLSMNYNLFQPSSHDESNDAYLLSSLSENIEFEANSNSLVSPINQQIPLNQPSPSTTSSLLPSSTSPLPSSSSSSVSSYLTITQPQILINSPPINNNQLQGQLINGLNGYDQNQSQPTPITMPNSLIFRYIPENSVIATTNQTMFIPVLPNPQTKPQPQPQPQPQPLPQLQPQSHQQQIFNLQPIVSTPQIFNSDHVFIQNININNFILSKNNNQPNLIGDHFLPTEGEGAFVNLIPFLEHEIDHDLNTTTK